VDNYNWILKLFSACAVILVIWCILIQSIDLRCLSHAPLGTEVDHGKWMTATAELTL